MKIRKATASDSKWILHHRIGMFRDMGESDDSLEATKKMTGQYLETDWLSDYQYFLVEEDDTIVAGCGISTFRIPPHPNQPSGVYAYLSNMFVEPEYRRRGIGKALLDYVIDSCKKQDIGLLLLHASKQGFSLYESLGFLNAKHLMHLRTNDYSNE